MTTDGVVVPSFGPSCYDLPVFTLRCTQRLLSRMKVLPSSDPVVEQTTKLGDWYANLLHLGRLQLVLAVSERTFLPVLVPAAPMSTLVPRLRIGVGDVLQALGIPKKAIEEETTAMADVSVGRTANRQVTGILVDFAKALEFYVDDEPSLHHIALKLAETPCSPLFKTTVSPDRTTVEVFEGRTRAPAYVEPKGY